jgi:uncharacterized protein YdhG (YjbR/CyaY superfamily)
MGVRFASIDDYIEAAPESARPALAEMRRLIREAVPEAVECIAYQMPAFRLDGACLVYFAAARKHIGLYPTSSGVAAFGGELAAYGTSKGTVRFPLGTPIPGDLVKRIAAFRAGEVAARRR